MADNDYYRRLIDSDREETETTERQIKDDAGKILEETGADDPNKELFDDSNYVSPFSKRLTWKKSALWIWEESRKARAHPWKIKDS